MLKILITIKSVFIIGVFLPLISVAFDLYANDSVKINTYTDYPPYLYQEEGQQTGLYLSIIDLTFKAINQPYSIYIVPFKRGLYRTQQDDGIMIAVLKTKKRMQTLDFSEPYYQERLSVYFNHQPRTLINTIDKLSGLNIGTLLGWSYGAEFDQVKANSLFSTNDSTLETNFNLLAKGRLDAVIHSELSAAYVLNKLALQNNVFQASKPLALGNIHIAVKKVLIRNCLIDLIKS